MTFLDKFGPRGIGACESCKIQKVHLILHTDSIKTSDVNTFSAAAKTLEAEYIKHYKKFGHDVVRMFVKTGQEIVNKINSYQEGTIVSLDIVSHGNQGGIHISKKLRKPIESGFIQKRVHQSIRSSEYDAEHPQTKEDAEYIEESMHGLYSGGVARKIVSYYFNQTYENKESDNGELVKNNDCATLSDIDFGKFTDDAFAEFHGCRTAEHHDVLNRYLTDNFATNFSEQLSSKSRTIGHITNAAPNENPNKNKSDYRYGKVRVYSDGEQLQDATERWGQKFINSSTPP